MNIKIAPAEIPRRTLAGKAPATPLTRLAEFTLSGAEGLATLSRWERVPDEGGRVRGSIPMNLAPEQSRYSQSKILK